MSILEQIAGTKPAGSSREYDVTTSKISQAAKNAGLESLEASTNGIRHSLSPVFSGTKTDESEISLESFLKGKSPVAGLASQQLGVGMESLTRSIQVANALRVGSDVSKLTSMLNSAARPSASLESKLDEAEITFGLEGLSNITEASASLEAFDMQPNSNIVENTVEFGLKVAQRSPLEEAFYPVRPLAITDSYLSVELSNLYIFNSVRRNPNGAMAQWGRKSLITARVNGELLANDTTKLIPIYREGGANDTTRFFVPQAEVTPIDTNYMGSTVKTSWLLTGYKEAADLMGLSQSDDQLAQGRLDETDALDSSFYVSDVLLKLVDGGTTEYIPLSLANDATASALNKRNGNTRTLQVAGAVQVTLSKDTKKIDGTPSAILGSKLGDNTATVAVVLNVTAVQDTGKTTIFSPSLDVVAYRDVGGVDVPAATAAPVISFLQSIPVPGIKLDARLTNSNKRRLGNVIDKQTIKVNWAVPLLSPWTVQIPINADASKQAQTVNDLATVVREQRAVEAVQALQKAIAGIKTINGKRPTLNDGEMPFGAASAYVSAYYRNLTIKVVDVNNLTESSKLEDVGAKMLNGIREAIADAYVQSNYAVVAQHLGESIKPVVAIAGCPYTLSFLQRTGESRLLGEMFDYVLVPEFNKAFENKLAVSFVTNRADSILSFGWTAQRPDTAVVISAARNNRYTNEMSVQGSWRFINNLPIVIDVTVEGLAAAVSGKSVVNMKTV